MLANILVIAFLIAMAYWWSLQGFFSAFLHMVIVMAAGAIALAMWEPMAHWLLGRMPYYAWGVGLLAPFVILVIAARVTTDKLIHTNMQFDQITGAIGGGACGLVSAALTAGLTIIGLSFLPLGPTVGGYSPYRLNQNVQVVADPTGGLWVDVDYFAASFFKDASNAIFYTGNDPFYRAMPDLVQQASAFRLGPERNSAKIAVPGTVEVADALSHTTPIPDYPQQLGGMLPDRITGSGHRIVVIDTNWLNDKPGTFDGSKLNVFPASIQLVTEGRADGRLQTFLHFPDAAVIEDTLSGDRRLMKLNDVDKFPTSTAKKAKIGWIFVVPDSQDPIQIITRRLRHDLPDDTEATPEQLVRALGTPPQSMFAVDGGGVDDGPPDSVDIGGREGTVTGATGLEAKITQDLFREISSNWVPNIRHQNRLITDGQDLAKSTGRRPARDNALTGIYVDPAVAPVRVTLTRDRARSMYGQAMQFAGSVAGIYLTDNIGQEWQPIAYVWHRSDDSIEINYQGAGREFRSARQLPIDKMARGGTLYLYFGVQKGVTIETLNFGPRTKQQVNLQIPRD